MYVILFLMVFSVFIRRFIPAKGFLLDAEIEALTHFGDSRKIELRDLTGCNVDDLVVVSDRPVIIPKSAPVESNTSFNNEVQSEYVMQSADEGVNLSDIKGKTYKEVDTNYMYGNMDSSSESLSDTLRKGGL